MEKSFSQEQIQEISGNQHSKHVRRSRLRNILGRMLPKIDPVISSKSEWMNGYWIFHNTHKSGRQREYSSLPPGVLFIPTAEFISPYDHLTDEEKALMVEQFEAPPIPSHVKLAEKKV